MLWLLLVTFLSFTICDPKRIKFRGREYLIYDQAHKACYSEAKAICKLQKGKLAKLTSADVRDFLASHLTCHSYIGQYKFEKFEEGAACLTAWIMVDDTEELGFICQLEKKKKGRLNDSSSGYPTSEKSTY